MSKFLKHRYRTFTSSYNSVQYIYCTRTYITLYCTYTVLQFILHCTVHILYYSLYYIVLYCGIRQKLLYSGILQKQLYFLEILKFLGTQFSAVHGVGGGGGVWIFSGIAHCNLYYIVLYIYCITTYITWCCTYNVYITVH